jgi:hypothetical protein
MTRFDSQRWCFNGLFQLFHRPVLSFETVSAGSRSIGAAPPGMMWPRSAALPSGIGDGYYREMVLLCLKKQLALSIKLKRDISPIFPDIRLAGEMFQKTREAPRICIHLRLNAGARY